MRRLLLAALLALPATAGAWSLAVLFRSNSKAAVCSATTTTYSTPGTFTFDPGACGFVTITACGGGGPGGDSVGNGNWATGGGGSAPCEVVDFPVSGTYTVQVASATTSNTANGGTTFFGSLLTLSGGLHGSNASAVSQPGGAPGTKTVDASAFNETAYVGKTGGASSGSATGGGGGAGSGNGAGNGVPR